MIDLDFIERGLKQALSRRSSRLWRWSAASSASSVPRVKPCGGRRSRRERIDALYFTGGSTGLEVTLVAQLAAGFPSAQAVRGDRYASVVSGLAITAERRFPS